MGSCSAPISSLWHLLFVFVLFPHLLFATYTEGSHHLIVSSPIRISIFNLQYIYFFNLKSYAYTSIVFLLEILSIQFMKYSVQFRVYKYKNPQKSNERERNGSKAQREWHRDKSQTSTIVGLQPLKIEH